VIKGLVLVLIAAMTHISTLALYICNVMQHTCKYI
jgi:hypothetical protein